MKTVTKFVDTMPRELHGRGLGTYTIDEMYRLAQVCYDSGMFADVKDAAQALIKIMRGQEMGLPPVTAMSAYDIIQNRLYVKPWVLAAKINSCGYGSYQLLEKTGLLCQIQFRRRFPQVGWQALPLETYTIEDAKAQGLLGRAGNWWKAAPDHMLYLRAMGRGAMRHFPELASGLEPSGSPLMPLDDPDAVPGDEQAHATIAELWPSTGVARAPHPRVETDRVPLADVAALPAFMLDVTPYAIPDDADRLNSDRAAWHTVREQYQQAASAAQFDMGRCTTWVLALYQHPISADIATTQWRHAMGLIVSHEADGGLNEPQRAWLRGEDA